MMQIYDRLFETDRHQQSDRNGRDVDEKLSPSMNVLVRWMYLYHRFIGLTRLKISDREADARGLTGERWMANPHKIERTLARGSLHRLVRPFVVGRTHGNHKQTI